MGAYELVNRETKMKIQILMFFLISSLSLGALYSAENTKDVVEMLNSNDWIVRERGVMAAMTISDKKQVRIELIKLLERENEQYERLEKGLSADLSSGEYYGELLEAVEQLNDPRAIKGLVGAVNTGFGAIDAIVGFGELSIDPLMDVFINSKRETIKQHIIETTNQILNIQFIFQIQHILRLS